MSAENHSHEAAAVPSSSSAAQGTGEAAKETSNGEAAVEEVHDPAGGESPEMLGNFPPEIATLLIAAGVAGVLLPGPVGAPLLIAGGVVLWPKTFQPIEKWFSRKFPSAHREGVSQLKEFLGNLKNRFPDDEPPVGT